MVSEGFHPFGLTDYESAEKSGEPRCKQVGSDGLRVWERMVAHPAYVADAFFHVGVKGPQIVSLSINPWTLYPWPPPLLTASVQRSAPVTRLYEQARGYLAISEQIGLTLDVDLKDFRKTLRPGRKGRPDIFYAGLAKEYVDLLGESTAPTRDLALKLGYTTSSIRDFLHQARVRGLLTGSAKGLAGGHLTEKAKGLLGDSR